MQRPFLEAKFYETYHFANVIRNVLSSRFDYLRSLDEFYGDDNCLRFARPFPRYSALHSFIEFVVHQLLIDEEAGLGERQEWLRRFASIPEALLPHPSRLPLNEALCYYEIPHTSFSEWLAERSLGFDEASEDDVLDYYQDLQDEGPYNALLGKAVDEVFHVLFQNRRLLLLFNDMIACQLSEADLTCVPAELRPCFARSGVLRRATMPAWVQRAIFFRDRGLCVLCRCDLSGVLSVGSIENYDHIVPLAQGGLNDVTNIQLLCQRCNLEKHDRGPQTSDLYETWYITSAELKEGA
jgi:hypothetical protein